MRNIKRNARRTARLKNTRIIRENSNKKCKPKNKLIFLNQEFTGTENTWAAKCAETWALRRKEKSPRAGGIPEGIPERKLSYWNVCPTVLTAIDNIKNNLSKLRTSCCINCLYVYEPVMLSTVPCLHWRYLSVHCLDTLRLWLLSFQFCVWLYCTTYSVLNCEFLHK